MFRPVRVSLVLLLPALLANAIGCSRADSAPAPLPDRRPLVEVVEVAPAIRPNAVRASGLVVYKRETELSFDAPGVIETLRVDEGDRVREGEVLGTLRRTSVGSNATEAALARETARRLLERTRKLHARGFASDAALEDAELAVERANEATLLVAPASGVVLRRLAEPAQMTHAGAPVLLLGEVESGVIVRASVPALAAARLTVGDPAEVRVAGQVETTGHVSRIAAKGDEITGAFEIEIRVDAPAQLRSGQVAAVQVAAAGAAAVALQVPTLALLDARADQGVVFVVDGEGIARRRSVQTAGIEADSVVVVAGLAAGERVVAAGVAYVRDGESVEIANRS
jgi:RND family efflux transporter MFP subunit